MEETEKTLGLAFYDEEVDLAKNNQNNDFNDNKITNLDNVTVKRDPSSDNEVARKEYIDKELNKNTILRFIQTLENYLKVSVGNNTHNLTKYNRIQLIDTTVIKQKKGQNLLPCYL